MDIIDCKGQFRRYVRPAHETSGAHRKGDDTALDNLPASNDSDPLTQLLNYEEHLTSQRHYNSFTSLSHDLNTLIDEAL